MYLSTVCLSWVAPHTNFLFYYLLNSFYPPSFHSVGSIHWGKRKGRVKECDPDTSSSACSDKQGNIPPADSWHAIVTCCWILFQTVRPLAECLAFKCVQARACMRACVCVGAHTHMHACEIVGLFQHFLLHSYVRTLHTNIAQFKENIDFFFFFWSHRSVGSILSRVCGVSRGSRMCLATVLPVVYVKTTSRRGGFLGRACQHSTKIKRCCC